MRAQLRTYRAAGIDRQHRGRQHSVVTRARRAVGELAPETIEQIAQRVAQLLRKEPADAPASVGWAVGDQPVGLLTAGQLAQRLGVRRSWVYEHATRLGAISLGEGPKARLRFDLDTAMRALAQANSQAAPAAASDRRGRRRRPPAPEPPVPLLPINRGAPRGRLSLWSRSRRWRDR